MKHIIFLATLFASFNVMAADPAPGIAIVKARENLYNLFYKGEENSNKVRLSIHDNRGNLVMARTYNTKTGFRLPLNFEAMEEGAYTIKLADGKNIFTSRIAHEQKKNKSLLYVSRVHKADNKFLVNFVVPQPDILTFEIYDTKNNLLYSNTKAFDHDDAVVMNMQQLKGPFVFGITNSSGLRQFLVK